MLRKSQSVQLVAETLIRKYSSGQSPQTKACVYLNLLLVQLSGLMSSSGYERERWWQADLKIRRPVVAMYPMSEIWSFRMNALNATRELFRVLWVFMHISVRYNTNKTGESEGVQTKNMDKM